MRRLLVLLAAALVAAACTSDEPPVAGPRATAGPPASPSPQERTSRPVAGESPFAADADVLRVAIPEPSTLDPMLLQDPGSMLVARQLFEGLTRWDPERREVVPAAAERWQVRRGGRRFVFHLRDGMRFHNGSRVTAANFKFAFDRIARRQSGSDLAYTLDRVEGFVEANQLGSADGLSGVEARSKRRLVITLTEPFHEFPVVLTHPGLVPLPRRAVQKLDRFVAEPVGNGPFRMARPWASGEEVVLEAFEAFWSPPRLDGIRFVPFDDAAQSWLLFRQEGLDVSEVPVGQIELAGEEYGEAGYLPLLNAAYYGINLQRKPLRDRRVRRAVNAAIDREKIARGIYKGTMRPPRGIVPEGMPGFDADACAQLCRHDPDEARRLVSDLPKRKRRLTLEFTRGAPHAQVAASVAGDLRAAGFRVNVRAFGFPRYLRRLRDGNQGVYRLGWIAEYPTPDAFLTPLFASDAPDNHSGFSSKKVDRLLRRAHRAKTRAARLAAYRRAERLVLRALPVVPIGSFEIHWAVQPEVQNLRFDVTGGFDAVGVSLARD